MAGGRVRAWMSGLAAAGLLAGALVGASVARASEPVPVSPLQVIVVRHAEKATEPRENPPLSAPGEQRAKRLAEMLSAAPVIHLYASEFRRTQLTLQPLAEAKKLPLTIVPANDPAALARVIREQGGGLAVVAGHSNTIGPILEALGAEPIGEISDSDYDNLFVATVPPEGKVSVLRLRFPPATP